MRYLLIVLLFVLSSCSASWHIKRAEQKEPGIFKTDIQIEYRDTIIHLDTLITFDISDMLEIDTVPNIVYEKVFINKDVKILPTFDTIIKTDKGLTAKIWMRKGILKANFEVDSSYIFHLQDSIKILNKVIIEKRTVKIENNGFFSDLFDKVSVILFIFLLVALTMFFLKR